MFLDSWSCTLVFWPFSILFWIFCKLSALTFLKCYSFLYFYPVLTAVLCSWCKESQTSSWTSCPYQDDNHGEYVIQLDLLSWSGFTLWSNGVLLGWGGSYQLGLVPRAWTKPKQPKLNSLKKEQQSGWAYRLFPSSRKWWSCTTTWRLIRWKIHCTFQPNTDTFFLRLVLGAAAVITAARDLSHSLLNTAERSSFKVLSGVFNFNKSRSYCVLLWCCTYMTKIMT